MLLFSSLIWCWGRAFVLPLRLTICSASCSPLPLAMMENIFTAIEVWFSGSITFPMSNSFATKTSNRCLKKCAKLLGPCWFFMVRRNMSYYYRRIWTKSIREVLDFRLRRMRQSFCWSCESRGNCFPWSWSISFFWSLILFQEKSKLFREESGRDKLFSKVVMASGAGKWRGNFLCVSSNQLWRKLIVSLFPFPVTASPSSVTPSAEEEEQKGDRK